MAEITQDFAAIAPAQFLSKQLVPAFRRLRCPMQRVLTDQGNEFRGAFDHTCAELGNRHRHTKPRHGSTNGFVEHLQGTILNEHGRIEPALVVGQGFIAGISPG